MSTAIPERRYGNMTATVGADGIERLYPAYTDRTGNYTGQSYVITREPQEDSVAFYCLANDIQVDTWIRYFGKYSRRYHRGQVIGFRNNRHAGAWDETITDLAIYDPQMPDYPLFVECGELEPRNG